MNNSEDLPSHINSTKCPCNPTVFTICPYCSDRETEDCHFCGGKLPVIIHHVNQLDIFPNAENSQ